jgi:hypothetical protein
MFNYKQVSILLNSPQVLMAVFFCIFEIWFNRYEWRTVGVGVTYAAYLVLAILFSNFANFCYWFVIRKNPPATLFHKRVYLISFALVVLLIALSSKFEFAGTGGIPVSGI